MARALLIDDDARLYELLRDYLADNGVTLHQATDAVGGLVRLGNGAFDVVLLDVMTLAASGPEVLRKIRERHELPVIALSARGDEADRLARLTLGADDHVAKPFSPRELLARLRWVLRRTGPDAVDEHLGVAGITVELGARHVTVDGHTVVLTARELSILAALMRRAGRVVPRETLLEQAGRGGVHVGERSVDVHISHLRKKLGNPRRIRSVRGVGYVLDSDPAGSGDPSSR